VNVLKNIVIVAAMALSYAVVSLGGSVTAQEVLEKMKKKYDSMDDVQLRFSQRLKFSIAKMEQSRSGLLLVKKENKYRVEFDDQTIVTDGETVWSFSLSNNRVLIDRFKMNESSLSPDKILAGAPKDYSAVLLDNEKMGGKDVVVLKLVPKNENASVKTMKLWVDEGTWLTKKVELVDVGGNETTYVVEDFKTNLGLPDSRFTYQIPQGVEVVDLR
jgi:outer membrane lipoprotein carrier protein